jgi:RNA polymerase sigma-70 factor (ECF subfamily)
MPTLQEIQTFDQARATSRGVHPFSRCDAVIRAVRTIPATHAAMREAFEAHYVSLLRLGAALVGRRDVAEDLVQEAFVRAASKLEQLNPEETGPYLRRVVVNLSRDRFRRLAVEIRHLRKSARNEPDQSGSFEDRQMLWRSILRLPIRQRACVVLRFYEGMSEAEVAEVLECAVGTVKSQTSRAMTKLRKELGDED